MIQKNTIEPGKYLHYKGKYYEVIGEGTNTETREELVVYKALYDCKSYPKDYLWIRPKKMFLEHIEIEGKKIPRFKKVNS